ncbi:MAG: OmpA family protein [Bradymonadaceae bacterium]|nr:OmpA family protein [Lujinxingiaceae bacterium]
MSLFIVRLHVIVVLVGLLFMSSACTTGAKLRGQAKEIQALNQSVYPRAYRCAPREIAVAQAHVEFGLYELGQGDFVRADQHLRLAEENAKRAEALSAHDECLDGAIAMEVSVARPVEVTRAPTNFSYDSDGDGIPDHLDKCPFEPEDFDGFQDGDGCPDLDNDEDGTPDLRDHCPNVAANVDGFPGKDGCPVLDLDGDGVLNINDQCPTVPVEFIGYQDETGCPVEDVDGDNIPNVLDECPFEPGPLDNAGCPRKEPKLAEIDGDQIRLNQRVHFATAKADILPQSYPLLNEVAKVLQEHPNLTIRVEGHTDSRGKADYNKKLSQDRAASVRQFLNGRGIDAMRMEAVGFGLERPIDDNNTEEGRANNRRVEIHITSR